MARYLLDEGGNVTISYYYNKMIIILITLYY